MDLDKIKLFSMMKQRLDYIGQRQEVLSQNIANADTPGYKAKDLEPFKFQDLVRQESMQVNMVRTDTRQLPGRRRKILDFATHTERHPYETSTTGNSVVLEEQMAKVNANNISHRLTTELYRKHLQLIRIAIGQG